MIIYIIRHAEVYNPDHITLRRKPGFNLSEYGKKQAKAVGLFIAKKSLSFNCIYTSPLERCMETAAIVNEASGSDCKIEVEDVLNEWEVGERSHDIELRTLSVLDNAVDGSLLVSHQDVIRVLINSLTGLPLRNMNLECKPGSLYSLTLDNSGSLVEFELLFEP